MATVNLATKYSPLLAKRFTSRSMTDRYAGKKYDFDGVQSIKIYTVDKVSLNNYNRTTDPSGASRFGSIADLGDTVQTLTMSDDKSFTFSIDKGNSADQINIKRCNEQIKAQWDEVCTPYIDAYRFNKWANGAGLGAVGTAPSPSTWHTLVATASAAMSNKLVPKANRTLFVSETTFIACKMSDKILALDSTGKEALVNGAVGRFDGMDVVPIPDSLFPTGLCFMIKYKDATVDPMKLKTLRVQKTPMGVDGDVGECRFYHDSFVVGAKVNGIYAFFSTGTALAAPTLTNTSNEIKFACTNSTGIKYTVDGTDPKTSATATTVLAAAYNTGVAITAGQTMRAYAYATTGYANSAISETTYA